MLSGFELYPRWVPLLKYFSPHAKIGNLEMLVQNFVSP